MDRLLLRPAEAAEVLGVSRSKLYELMASGTLPTVRLGKCVRVSRVELELWVKKRARPIASGAPRPNRPPAITHAPEQ
jgi:excisionase family DNA binding protein